MVTNAIKITQQDFFGLAEVNKALRGLAIDNARNKFSTDTVTKVTDSTGGTASKAGVITALVTPPPFTVTATDLAPKAGFDTATGKLADCADSVASMVNKFRAPLGLPLVVHSTGTVTAAIPALDLLLTAVDGTGGGADGVDDVTGQAQIDIAKNNFATLMYATNEVLAALGFDLLVDASTGVKSDSLTLAARSATAAAVTGVAASQSLADTAVDLFLTNIANDYATLIYWLNYVTDPDEDVNLTDSTGGTASTTVPPTIVLVDAAPTAHQDAATNSAPKAAFDTELAKIENNFADLTLRVNDLVRYMDLDLGLLTDSTTGTANTTLEVIDDTLTAVDGTGSNSLANTEAVITLGLIADNFATVTAKVNALSAFAGLDDLVDSSGGTVSATNVMVATPTTGAGVDNGAAATGVADADLDAILDVITDNMATLVVRLNAIDNRGGSRALQVVAGL